MLVRPPSRIKIRGSLLYSKWRCMGAQHYWWGIHYSRLSQHAVQIHIYFLEYFEFVKLPCRVFFQGFRSANNGFGFNWCLLQQRKQHRWPRCILPAPSSSEVLRRCLKEIPEKCGEQHLNFTVWSVETFIFLCNEVTAQSCPCDFGNNLHGALDGRYHCVKQR